MRLQVEKPETDQQAREGSGWEVSAYSRPHWREKVNGDLCYAKELDTRILASRSRCAGPRGRSTPRSGGPGPGVATGHGCSAADILRSGRSGFPDAGMRSFRGFARPKSDRIYPGRKRQGLGADAKTYGGSGGAAGHYRQENAESCYPPAGAAGACSPSGLYRRDQA